MTSGTRLLLTCVVGQIISFVPGLGKETQARSASVHVTGSWAITSQLSPYNTGFRKIRNYHINPLPPSGTIWGPRPTSLCPIQKRRWFLSSLHVQYSGLVVLVLIHSVQPCKSLASPIRLLMHECGRRRSEGRLFN